jgi:hypothetical protein
MIPNGWILVISPKAGNTLPVNRKLEERTHSMYPASLDSSWLMKLFHLEPGSSGVAEAVNLATAAIEAGFEVVQPRC